MIRHHDFEGYVIAYHGGYAVEVDGADTYAVILTLIEMLRNRQIKGFLLDRQTLWHFHGVVMKRVREKENRKKRTLDFFMKETIATEKKYVGPNLSHGLLVKNVEHY